MNINELSNKELLLLIQLVGNYVMHLDETVRGSEGAYEKPTVLKERLDEAEALYQKLFQEVYGK